MKKILIIGNNMNVGGVQKSLISLINSFDYTKYDVDLALMDTNGIFKDYIPENVNVINFNLSDIISIKSKKMIIKHLINHPVIFGIKVMSSLVFRFNKGLAAVLLSKAMPKLGKEYDVAIDYCGQAYLYYMVKRVKAKKKITFFHNDYSKWDFYEKTDRKYYRYVDYIATVSIQCVESMKKYFPEFSNKIKCIENITTKKTICLFKQNKNPYPKQNIINILTVGRVCYQKGNDIAIEACYYLKEKGLKFTWYVLGPIETDEKEEQYQNLIKKYNVENEYVLLGSSDNPYDYMDYATIIAHPARFEGKAVSIDEAMLLNKVIVTTNFSTVYDQIKNLETGVITEMDAKAFANGLFQTLKNENLMEKIKENLKENFLGNECEIEKLYKLID